MLATKQQKEKKYRNTGATISVRHATDKHIQSFHNSQVPAK